MLSHHDIVRYIVRREGQAVVEYHQDTAVDLIVFEPVSKKDDQFDDEVARRIHEGNVIEPVLSMKYRVDAPYARCGIHGIGRQRNAGRKMEHREFAVAANAIVERLLRREGIELPAHGCVK